MKEKIIFLAIALVMLVVIIGSSYAFLSTQSESSKNHIVKAGKLEISFSDANDSKINLEGAYPIPDSEGMKGMPHTFTITNTGTLPASYQISLSDNTTLYNSHNDTGKIFDENQLKLGIINGNGNTTYQLYKKGAFIEGTLDSGKSATYTIRMWIPEHIGNEVQGYHFHGNIKVDSIQTLGTKNQNITKIYTYNQTTGASNFCVTGEEVTCQEIKEAPATYDVGTIIKYKVNETEEKYFFVMQDNGDTLTLQQRENTFDSVQWYLVNGENDNTKGPTTILPVLENVTNGWSNVNDLTYTLGTTTFKNNSYTGCSTYNTCTNNQYMLSKRTAKARMITVQEASTFGCTNSYSSCPVWLYNYSYDSIKNGGTVDDKTDYGYWTSTASLSSTIDAWFVEHVGRVSTVSTKNPTLGARAVIEINKLDRDAVTTVPRNENILAIFKYNQNKESSNFCVTGEEFTCEQIYETPTTYEKGTIIQYKLNDYTIKYFFVISDDGNHLTMQQRENTVYNIAWYEGASDNTKGPVTILSMLEDKTANWTNVLDQTYTLGTTVFKDNAFTGCDYNASTNKFSCTKNTYTLASRTTKARMISVQEASSLGCLGWESDLSTDKSCPVWMRNYLNNSIKYGGTVNQTGGEYGNNEGYWTSTAMADGSIIQVWKIPHQGHLGGLSAANNTHYGARAVVVIQK